MARKQPNRMYRDGNEVPFHCYRHFLKERVSEWTRPRIPKDANIVLAWRKKWVGKNCWWCGNPTSEIRTANNHGEVHHMARYDIPTCFAWLCADCHRITGRAVFRENLGRLLTVKYLRDRENLSWPVLAACMGKLLPEPYPKIEERELDKMELQQTNGSLTKGRE